MRQVSRWLRDRVWATVDPPQENPADDAEQSRPEIGPNADEGVVRAVYEQLAAELETEAERRRAVQTKLAAVGSVAPIAVTIIVAVATFLSSGRSRDFTPASVIVVAVTAFYAALQFLRAMLAAIRGLSRKSYAAPRVSSILSVGTEGRVGYLRSASNDLARRIEQHRETTNENVSELAVAHASIINAVAALIIAIVILSGLIVWESLR